MLGSNVTVSVPNGFSNHGNDHLFCIPTQWHHHLMFYALNYAAHAATSKPHPGQTLISSVRDFVFALLWPYSGVLRAIETFRHNPWPWEELDELTRAARANALCKVARSEDWEPLHPQELSTEITSYHSASNSRAPSLRTWGRRFETSSSYEHQGDFNRLRLPIECQGAPEEDQEEFELSNLNCNFHGNLTPERNISHHEDVAKDTSTRPSIWLAKSQARLMKGAAWILGFQWQSVFCPGGIEAEYNIHGLHWLPKGYHLEFLPRNAHVTSDPEGYGAEVKLCKSQNKVRAFFAICQAIVGISTLLHARGDQIQQFGSAAPFLTVIRYVIMSIVNSACNLMVPDYPAIYVVRSQEMDEAIARGAKIDGTVGRLVQRVHPQANLPVRRIIEPSHGRRWPEKLTIGRSSSHRQIQIVSQDKTFRTTNVVRRTDCDETAKGSMCFLLVVQFVLGSIPYLIVGFWTKFQSGKINTWAQFIFTSLWLLVDVIFGPYVEWAFQVGIFHIMPLCIICTVYVVALWSLACAVGGLVVVGQMLQTYGYCTKISGLGS